MTATTVKPQPTVITIVLPSEADTKPASLTIQQGDLGHVSMFQHDDFATICRALNAGLGKLLAIQANPPGDVESAAKKVKPKTKTKSKSKAKSAKKPFEYSYPLECRYQPNIKTNRNNLSVS